MTEPPTLILDDEERTLISPPSFSRGSLSSEQDGGTRKPNFSVWMAGVVDRIRVRWPLLVSTIAVSALICVLALWLHQERRVAARLRNALSDVSTTVPPHLPKTTTSEVLANDHPVRLVDKQTSKRGQVQSIEELVRQGAGLLVENRLSDAIVVYRDLARRRPDDRVFSDIVRVLERKLGCRVQASFGKPGCD
jgi:hypothetical protein